VDKCNDAMEMALEAAHNVDWAITHLPQGIMAARCCATKMQLKRSREMLPSMCGWGECSRD
jgi:hypothetical protein